MTPQDEAHIKALEEENRRLREALLDVENEIEGQIIDALSDALSIVRAALQKEPQS